MESVSQTLPFVSTSSACTTFWKRVTLNSKNQPIVMSQRAQENLREPFSDKKHEPLPSSLRLQHAHVALLQTRLVQ